MWSINHNKIVKLQLLTNKCHINIKYTHIIGIRSKINTNIKETVILQLNNLTIL